MMIHDTDYTPELRSETQKVEMGEWVKSIVERVLGATLPREVNILVDPNAGVKGNTCYCTSATYMVAVNELPA